MSAAEALKVSPPTPCLESSAAPCGPRVALRPRFARSPAPVRAGGARLVHQRPARLRPCRRVSQLDPAPWQGVDTLDLLTELKRRVEMPPSKNIILIGPPGSGKGTQVPPTSIHLPPSSASRRVPPLQPTPWRAAQRVPAAPCVAALWQAPIIKEKHCLCHLATGDLLRAAVTEGALLPSPIVSVSVSVAHSKCTRSP